MSFEFNGCIRALILLLGTAFVDVAFRKASASTRHTIWVLGLTAVLVLPAASVVLPDINVFLPRNAATAIPWITEHSPIVNRPENASFAEQSPPPLSTSEVRRIPLRWWLALMWSAGALVVIGRWLIGIREVGALRRNSSVVEDDRWRALLSAARRDLGVAAAVELRIGGNAIPPMMWGVLRHTILFPSAAAEWSTDRLHHAITHELAHVRRKDGITQILMQSVCAIHWFNPLVWYAAHRIRVEREHACDDALLKLGVNAEDYAGHLLQTARDVSYGWKFAHVSMTDPSGLETRLRAILDSGKNRGAPSRRLLASLICSTALLTFFSGAIHLAAHTMQASAPKWTGTWRLNKGKSNFGKDAEIQAMLDLIDTVTTRLEATTEAMAITSDVIGTRPGSRHHGEGTIKFGVTTDLKDVFPLFVAFPATVLVRPINDSLEIILDSARDRSTTTIRFDVSTDGNTLTESTPPTPLDDFRIVFDRQ
jgi:beta-lactamase regulating signal transducer with metallopeptidase domain